MASWNLIRAGGGLASAAAGILLLVGHVLNLGGDPEYGTVPGASSVLTAHVLLVFALVALYAAQAERTVGSGCPRAAGSATNEHGPSDSQLPLYFHGTPSSRREVGLFVSEGLTERMNVWIIATARGWALGLRGQTIHR